MWCLRGATPRGQPWTPAVTLPHGCDGLSAWRMGVLWTFREPALCRHVRRELMRNALRDFTPIIPTTACHQRNYVETYSRFIGEILFEGHGGSYSMGMENVLIPKENRSYLVTTQQGQKADRNALSCGQGRG